MKEIQQESAHDETAATNCERGEAFRSECLSSACCSETNSRKDERGVAFAKAGHRVSLVEQLLLNQTSKVSVLEIVIVFESITCKAVHSDMSEPD